MKLRWFADGDSKESFDTFESEGIPPLIGQKVYINGTNNVRKTFIVVGVHRSIHFAGVGLDVIRPNLTKTDPSDRFTEAYDYATSLYKGGVPHMSLDKQCIHVCLDNAEIRLKLDQGYQDEGKLETR